MNLRGKKVLITGSGRGMGKAFAERIAAKGAHLVLVQRSFDENFLRDLKSLNAVRVGCWRADLQ